MLRNPWIAGTATGQILSDSDPPAAVTAMVARALGRGFERGFGYNSWVFVSAGAVVKVDPAPGRPGRFSHEIAVSELPGLEDFVPQIKDAGVVAGRAWIMQSRIPGRPAYEAWPDTGPEARDRFVRRLAALVRRLQSGRPREELLHAPRLDWPDLVNAQFERSLEAAGPALRAGTHRQARAAFEAWSPALSIPARRVMCHGDLWFGNVLVDAEMNITGIVDFDRLALAPADYELDMLLRFWTYPRDFVPEEREAAFEALPTGLMTPLVDAAGGGLAPEALRDRLGALELTYRLGIAARFGPGTKLDAMFERVLSGAWGEGVI